MSLNYVTLILDGFSAGNGQLGQGAATFTPSVQLSDPADHEWIPPAPVQAFFRAGLASPQVTLLATDNANVLPSGWGWTVSFQNVPGNPASFSFFLPFSGGATQYLSAQQPTQSVVTMAAYMPLPSGTPGSGQVPVATGNGEASAWGNVATNPMTTSGDTIYGGSGGAMTRLAGDMSNTRKFLREQSSGGVAQPPAWDTIAAGDVPTLNQNTTGTAANITSTLDQVPAPAANVSLNSKKVTNLANGTAASDAAAFGQIPVADSTASDIQPVGTAAAAGSNGKWADSGHVHAGVQLAGDLGNTISSPQVLTTHLSSALPVNQGGTGSATRNFAGLLTPTAVKTGAYTAAAGDYVPCDTTTAAFTVTLPTAPADLTVIGVKMVIQGGTNAITVAAAGADVFNKASGPTSLTLTLLNQGAILQYKASSAIWYVFADDLALAQLDSRYVGSVTAADTSVVVAGTPTAPTVRTGTLDVVAAQHPPAADWSNNSHKITSVTAGVAGTDAANVSQAPAGIMTTLGDIIYENSTPAPARLAGSTSATKQFLTQTGTGSVSAAPAWAAIAAGDISPLLDATAADIAQLGTQAAGAVGKPPDAGHVHPAFAGIPGDNGLLTWSGSLEAVNTTSAALTAGVLNLIRIPIRFAFTATNLWIIVGTAGSGASTGSFCGLYNPSGTLLTGSSDIAGSLTSTGAKQLALTTPQAVTPSSFTSPWMWAVILVNLATTQPGLRSNTADTPAILDLNLAAASYRVGANSTAQTTLPASITPSSNTTTNAHPFWVGVS